MQSNGEEGAWLDGESSASTTNPGGGRVRPGGVSHCQTDRHQQAQIYNYALIKSLYLNLTVDFLQEM